MRFTRWLLTQSGEATAIGDLARDVQVDQDWPLGNPFVEEELELFEDYLDLVGACDNAEATLRKAWSEYKTVARLPYQEGTP